MEHAVILIEQHRSSVDAVVSSSLNKSATQLAGTAISIFAVESDLTAASGTADYSVGRER